MSNIKDRHQARKTILELLDVGGRGVVNFELQIAILQTDILDEYLEETLRSNKVTEGLLRDIGRDIEQGAKKVEEAIEDVTIRGR